MLGHFLVSPETSSLASGLLPTACVLSWAGALGKGVSGGRMNLLNWHIWPNKELPVLCPLQAAPSDSSQPQGSLLNMLETSLLFRGEDSLNYGAGRATQLARHPAHSPFLQKRCSRKRSPQVPGSWAYHLRSRQNSPHLPLMPKLKKARNNSNFGEGMFLNSFKAILIEKTIKNSYYSPSQYNFTGLSMQTPGFLAGLKFSTIKWR